MLSINRDKVLNISDNDHDFIHSLLEIFWSQKNQEEIDLLFKKIQSRASIEEIQPILHKIKPSFDMIGLSNFYNIIQENYLNLIQGENIESHLQTLENAFEKFIRQRDFIKESMYLSYLVD